MIEFVSLSDMISTISMKSMSSFGPHFEWINVVSYVLVYCTVFLKPIVYFCANKFFREAFFDTFPFMAFMKPKTHDKEEIQVSKLNYSTD